MKTCTNLIQPCPSHGYREVRGSAGSRQALGPAGSVGDCTPSPDTEKKCCAECKEVEVVKGRPLTEGGGYPRTYCGHTFCRCHDKKVFGMDVIEEPRMKDGEFTLLDEASSVDWDKLSKPSCARFVQHFSAGIEWCKYCSMHWRCSAKHKRDGACPKKQSPTPQPVEEKEGVDMGRFAKCLMCNERLCTCPERQPDGNWEVVRDMGDGHTKVRNSTLIEAAEEWRKEARTKTLEEVRELIKAYFEGWIVTQKPRYLVRKELIRIIDTLSSKS